MKYQKRYKPKTKFEKFLKVYFIIGILVIVLTGVYAGVKSMQRKQGALGALNEDTTQKNKNFVARHKSILTSEHGFLYELPSELKGLLQYSFWQKRFRMTSGNPR